jgi:hypothetical protein
LLERVQAVAVATLLALGAVAVALAVLELRQVLQLADRLQ